MHCPTCAQAGIASETRVADSRPSADGTSVIRRRICRSDDTHRFPTTERWPIPQLDQTYVRRGSDGRLSGLFSRARLRTDIDNGVFRRLPSDTLTSVVDDVCSQLSDRLITDSRPLTAAEVEELKPPFSGGSIADYDIMLAVEARLRNESDRVAHILYTLSYRGRVDTPGRNGFKGAEDFLSWFYSEKAYADHTTAIPTIPDRPEENWWPPRTPTVPESVIKRNGIRKVFGFEQFRKSIELALLGRYKSSSVAQIIADYVLFHLEGQPTVRSSQLASETIAALRMFDDIAYLRYAGIAKGFTSVRDFAAEAHGLIEQPSPRLRLTKKLASPYPVDAFRGASNFVTNAKIRSR